MKIPLLHTRVTQEDVEPRLAYIYLGPRKKILIVKTQTNTQKNGQRAGFDNNFLCDFSVDDSFDGLGLVYGSRRGAN